MCSTSFSFSQTFSMMSVSGSSTNGHGDRPRLRVGLGVVERELDLEVAVVLAAEALGDLHLLAAGMAAVVEPALVVEAERLHDERVAVPLAERVAEPRRRALFRVIASVGEDLAVLGEVLEQDDRELRASARSSTDSSAPASRRESSSAGRGRTAVASLFSCRSLKSAAAQGVNGGSTPARREMLVRNRPSTAFHSRSDRASRPDAGASAPPDSACRPAAAASSDRGVSGIGRWPAEGRRAPPPAGRPGRPSEIQACFARAVTLLTNRGGPPKPVAG